jgi:hypothetical protein
MAEPIDDHFTAALRAYPGLDPTSTVRDDDAPLRPGAALTVAQALDLFDAQLGSRHLDLAARAPRADGIGYYTIGSSGHGGNAGVAAARCPEGQTLAQSINAALQHVFETHPEAILFGEDVARKGGVYCVTRGLQKRFRVASCQDAREGGFVASRERARLLT